MTDETQNETNTENTSELDLLKQRARLLGVEFSNNIRVDTLRARIEAKLNEEPDSESTTEDQGSDLNEFVGDGTGPQNEGHESYNVTEPNPVVKPVFVDPFAEATKPVEKPTKLTLRQYLHDEAMKLVRVRITCLDPKKKDLSGEIVTVGNEYIGSVRKFVPFGEATEDGFHIPNVLYEYLKNRKFLNIRTVKNRRTGTESVESNYVPEFAIEVLEPLTADELRRLAIAQAAAGSMAE